METITTVNLIEPKYGEQYLVHELYKAHRKYKAFYIGKTRVNLTDFIDIGLYETEQIIKPSGHIFVRFNEASDELEFSCTYSESLKLECLSTVGKHIGFLVNKIVFKITKYEEEYLRDLIKRKLKQIRMFESFQQRIADNSTYGAFNNLKFELGDNVPRDKQINIEITNTPTQPFKYLTGDRHANYVLQLNGYSKDLVKKILFFDTKMGNYEEVSKIIPVYSIKSVDELFEKLELGFKTCVDEYNIVIITSLRTICSSDEECGKVTLKLLDLSREYGMSVIL